MFDERASEAWEGFAGWVLSFALLSFAVSLLYFVLFMRCKAKEGKPTAHVIWTKRRMGRVKIASGLKTYMSFMVEETEPQTLTMHDDNVDVDVDADVQANADVFVSWQNIG